jgi:ferritin-like metal-binding protein YciE
MSVPHPMKAASGSPRKQRAIQEVSDKVTPIIDLEDLFWVEFKYLHWAELSLLDALEELTQGLTSIPLKAQLERYGNLLAKRREKIENVLLHKVRTLDLGRSGAIECILNDADDTLDRIEKGHTYDAAVIMVVQKIQNYKISVYSTLCTFAKVIAATQEDKILRQCLEQEKESIEAMTEIASIIHESAANLPLE